LSKLIKSPNDERFYAIDQYWKPLQLNNTWFMLYPPSVIQYKNYSDIEKKVVDYKDLIFDLNKSYLFKNANANANANKMKFT